MSSKKIVIPALFLLLLTPVLAACGTEATPTTVTGGVTGGTTATTVMTGTESTATTAVGGAADTATAPAATAPMATTGTSGSATTFRWRAFAEPETFDPAFMQEFVSIDLGQNLYDGLTQFNPQTLVSEPAIAKSWDISPDSSVYTFHLRSDVKFTNGDPVTANDFKYSWNRVLNTPQAPYVYVLDDIKGAKDVEASVVSTDTTKPKVTEASGIEVVDPYTLKVTLNGPSAYFLAQTSLWTYYVVNQKVVSQCPKDKPSCFMETGKQMGAGTGAYVLDTWEHNQRLHMTVNPNYWQDKASVDVEVPIVKDTGTAQVQFENGQLDALDGPDPQSIKRIQSDAKLGPQLYSVGQARAVWIGLNVMQAPFGPVGDPKADALRQAIAMSIDRQQLVDLALSGVAGVPMTTLLPKGVPGYQDFQAYKFDAAAAKQKLADAGYANCQGLSLTYTTRDRDVEQAVATQLQAQLKTNLGCDVKVDVIPWKDMLTARQAHKYTMFYGSWGQDYPDPQDWLYALFDSSQIQGVGPGSGNDPGYSNPAFDKLIRDANVLADPSKQADRMKMYQQAEQMLLKDAPIVPLYQATRYWEASPKFTGYNTNAEFIYPLRLVKPAQ